MQGPPSNAQPPVLRVRRPFSDLDELVNGDFSLYSRQGMVLPGVGPLEPGRLVRFEVTLAGGAPVLRGEGSVVAYHPRREGVPIEGVEVKFLRLDGRGHELMRRVWALRRARRASSPPQSGGGPPESVAPVSPTMVLRQAPSPIPPPPAEAPPANAPAPVSNVPSAPPAPPPPPPYVVARPFARTADWAEATLVIDKGAPLSQAQTVVSGEAPSVPAARGTSPVPVVPVVPAVPAPTQAAAGGAGPPLSASGGASPASARPSPSSSPSSSGRAAPPRQSSPPLYGERRSSTMPPRSIAPGPGEADAFGRLRARAGRREPGRRADRDDLLARLRERARRAQGRG